MQNNSSRMTLRRYRVCWACFVLSAFSASVIVVDKVFLQNSVSDIMSNVSKSDGDVILQRRHFIKNGKPITDVKKVIRIFSQMDLIECFDELLGRKVKKKVNGNGMRFMEMEEFNQKVRVDSDSTLHFAFVGDSRIRQLFILFTEALPDYDKLIRPATYQNIMGYRLIRDEIVVYSKVLNVLVSYYWRTVLLENDGRDLSKFFTHWIDYDPRDIQVNNVTRLPSMTPDFLVVGIGLHHMLEIHDYHEREYFEKLRELLPIIKRLLPFSRIVWLSPYPTLEFYGNANTTNTQVHAAKILGYNLKADKIIREADVELWTSGSPLVEEYIRSCYINMRTERFFTGFFSCEDYIHPGASVLSDVLQILNNKICRIHD